MELINFIFQYIPLDYVLIVGGLIVVGEMFKKFTTLPNQFLTTTLPILGAVITGTIYMTSTDVLVVADFIKQICIGLLMGWASTGGYEFFKNTFLIKESNYKKEINYVKNDKEEKNEDNIKIENEEAQEEIKDEQL